MMGRTHAIAAGTLWLGACASAPRLVDLHPHPMLVVAGLPVAVAAGLAADMDHEGSRAANSLGWVTRLAAKGIRALFGHRGLTHGLPVATLAGVVGAFLGLLLGRGVAWLMAGHLNVHPAVWWQLGWPVLVGYVAHLLCDSATPEGSPFLHPFIRYRFHLLPGWFQIDTNGTAERRVVAPLLMVASAVLGCVLVYQWIHRPEAGWLLLPAAGIWLGVKGKKPHHRRRARAAREGEQRRRQAGTVGR